MRIMAVVCAFSVSLISCENDEDDGIGVIEETDNIIVTGNISSDVTWTSDKVYELRGRVAVTSGITLTIEAGTVIKGAAGTGANSTALIIARGAQLMANGTAAAPIIFTSVADQIESGQITSPNLDPTTNGLWGGLLILGNAPISASTSPVQIEGIPVSDQNGLYGGSDSEDNSGIITYISIRHGGANIGEGNEINGLTLGGVGSGTTISNVEVVGNQDDGIEWFGGTVDVTNALVWNAGDDGIDTDQAWSGTLDNFMVITVSDNSFELDGPEGSTNGIHTIKNGTVVASDEANNRISDDLINTDNNSMVILENIHITGIANGQVINRTVDNPDVTFTNITLDVDTAYLGDFIGDATSKAGISASATSAATGKANAPSFSWTWAAVAGKTLGL